MDPMCGIGRCMSFAIPGLYVLDGDEEVGVCTTHFLRDRRQERFARRRHPTVRWAKVTDLGARRQTAGAHQRMRR